ncbi:uncharacterized protein LOC123009987 [Tribolium madens]|uniref:uncharacterized protein LOC123009987 n=1 Tax=Tribolium madens TaxID=41895 RepID=UPI001CF72ED0|nr:uncharacterized protein LOC123009987 [Tribolium madens]
MKFIFMILVITSGESRTLWEPEVPKLLVPMLQKSPPLQLNQSYHQLEIVDISGTVFSHSFSQLYNVTELRITHSEIRKIESGALCSPPNLTILELDLSMNSAPPQLTQNMFKNCEKLDELFLKFDYNTPSTIEENALEGLSLKVFGVDSLEVRHLRKNFLKLNPKNLRKLFLSHIHLTSIDSDVFDGFSKLEEVEIVHNPELTQLSVDLFKNTRLKRLILRDNGLDLTWDELKNLTFLEELDVFDNQIKYFNATKIHTNLPNLKKFFMELNLQSCKTVEISKKELKEKYHSIEFPDEHFSQFCESKNLHL